jgi:hypothetical protein
MTDLEQAVVARRQGWKLGMADVEKEATSASEALSPCTHHLHISKALVNPVPRVLGIYVRPVLL